MGDRPELARLATDLLAAETPEPRPASSPESEIAAMAHAIEQSRKRRRVRSGFIAGAVLVAAAAAAFVMVRPHDSGKVAVAAVSNDDDEVLLQGGAERIGDRIVTNGGHATIVAKNGTRVAVDAHGDLDLERTQAMRKFALHDGALEANVAKLGPGQRFLVTTTDAEVEVRGTAFRVSVVGEPACGTRTSVTVTEGTVWVRFHGEESVVAAGSAWPKCEAQLPAPTPIPTNTTPIATATIAKPSVPPATTTAISASVLAEQNRIFEEAIAAKRRGDVEAAVSAFERVTQGPLAENAAAERFRVLGNDPRARAAARDYLARYPNGFAASEARAIAP